MTVDQDLLIILKSSGIGDGEPDLGEKLMKSFLTTLMEAGTAPMRIIALNSGIFLTTEGSPVAEQLQQLQKAGTEIYSCSTCLDYFERKDKLMVGKASNMKETVEAMVSFKRILTP